MNTDRWFVPMMMVSLAMPASLVAQPLRTNVDGFFMFAQRTLRANNLKLDSGCNLGVNCAQPSANSECGTATFSEIRTANGAQIAADDVGFQSSGASVWQLFTNGDFRRDNLELRHPGVQPLSTPIVAGACAAGCATNPAPLAAACGVPDPFPACAPGATVTATAGQDCAGAPDLVRGNGRCNLRPGTYGDVRVKDGAGVDLSAGVYTVCSFTVGKHADVTGVGSTVEIAAGASDALRVGNLSTFGGQCGDLAVHVAGVRQITFGKSASVAARLCAPASALNLGHGNSLTGQFVGDTIVMDRNNVGHCCSGLCTCIDGFTPTAAAVGTTVTLNSQCDLGNATAVRVCGIAAAITSQSANLLAVTVPPGAHGACGIEVDSAVGVFRAFETLAVP